MLLYKILILIELMRGFTNYDSWKVAYGSKVLENWLLLSRRLAVLTMEIYNMIELLFMMKTHLKIRKSFTDSIDDLKSAWSIKRYCKIIYSIWPIDSIDTWNKMLKWRILRINNCIYNLYTYRVPGNIQFEKNRKPNNGWF